MANPWSQKPIQFLTHIVQGLNLPVKRWKAFNYFHLVGAEIVFLQEIHFPSSYKPNYIHNHYSNFVLANAPDKTQGMSICVAKSLAFTLSQIITDPEGRYLLVKGDLEGTLVTLLS